MTVELLLGAALEASFSLLMEVGFGDELRELKDRWANTDENQRCKAFDAALAKAIAAGGDETIQPLLDHRPFQRDVVASLLDPAQALNVQAVAAQFCERFPQHARALRQFFNTLESELLLDETWGPLLQSFQDLRYRRDVEQVLQQRQVDLSAEQFVQRLDVQLDGSGAFAASGGIAAGQGGVAIGQLIQIFVSDLLSQPPVDWEAHYLRTLVSYCDPLDLTTIDPARLKGPTESGLGQVKLSDVFTTLYLKDLRRRPDQTVSDAIRRRGDPTVEGKKRAGEREELLPIQATEAVAASPRLVILGQPGAGKSTLVNHLTTQLAQRRLGEDTAVDGLTGWRTDQSPLPVRIVLRRFAAWIPDDTTRGEAGLVWDYLAYQLAQWGCGDAHEQLKRALIEEGGTVFFDGLDEVRETDEDAKRSLIKDAIAAFAAPLRHCQVMITCRQYAYVQGDAWRLPDDQFPVVELALFNMDQVKTFTTAWYHAVGPGKGWDEEKSQSEADGLYGAIEALPHLQELAQYPLLLTLMAQVHGRDGYLPRDRADLYERAVNLLLAHWENRIVRDERGGYKVEQGLILQLGIRVDVLRHALERAAFRAHEEQENRLDRTERAADIARLDLLEDLAAELKSFDAANEVLRYIQHRSGLLQALDNRTYAFPHRTFQEYLAATHLLRQAEHDTLLKERVRRDLEWWREVYLLAASASRSTPRIISDLVDVLVFQEPTSTTLTPDKGQEIELVAEALLETGFGEFVRREAEPGRYGATFGRIQRWLLAGMRADQSLRPPQRVRLGDALGRLDDPRFRSDAWYLPGEPLLGFVHVPAGPFLMGSDKKRDKLAYNNEYPQHSLALAEYYIARYPVTVAQFRAFVAKNDYDYDNSYFLTGLANHPVVWVTWFDAIAYGGWLTGELRDWKGTPEPLAHMLRDEGWQITLPSEAQWEKAARGSDGRIFPWGDELDANRANYRKTNIGSASSVGCFPGGASRYGVEDLSGNVAEWTRSLWVEGYPYPRDERERADRESLLSQRERVARGGAFDYDEDSMRCASRFRSRPYNRGDLLGFRVVVSPTPRIPEPIDL